MRAVREAQGLTQEELAAKLAVSHAQIVRYEAGKADPSAEVITRIARHLQVTTDYLLGLAHNTDEQLKQDDMSPSEHRLLLLWREGRFRDLMKLAAEKMPDVSSDQ